MNRKIEAQVRSRARFRCEYCLLPQAMSVLKFHLEHVIAKQHRGKDALSNLALACPFCNQHKGSNLAGVDPVSKQMVRLFHPRQDSWRDHFKMSGSRIVTARPL